MRSYEKWGRIQRVRHENAQDRQGFEGEPTRVFLLKKGEKATPSQLATHGDATEALSSAVHAQTFIICIRVAVGGFLEIGKVRFRVTSKLCTH